MAKCPSCLQQIDGNFSFCPHCGKPLSKNAQRWYFRNSSLVTGFLLFGPFILPLVWVNPAYSINKKIVITAIVLIFTAVLFLLMKGLLAQYLSLYDQLLGATR